MKRFYILIIALLIISGVKPQSKQPCSSCLPEGITFSTQAQIDSFQINYPDCSEIEGEVHIMGDDITDLNGLSALTSINSLIIKGNYSLKSLTGLENVNSIGAYLNISSNFSLANLTGLENLTSVAGPLEITGNNA